MIIWLDCVKTVSEPNLNKSEFISGVFKLFLHLLCSKLAVNWWYAQYMSVNMQDFSFEISLQISYNWCHSVGLELRSYNLCHSVGLEMRWNTFMIYFDLKVLSSLTQRHALTTYCRFHNEKMDEFCGIFSSSSRGWIEKIGLSRTPRIICLVY
jgi:hypothetical protein